MLGDVKRGSKKVKQNFHQSLKMQEEVEKKKFSAVGASEVKISPNVGGDKKDEVVKQGAPFDSGRENEESKVVPLPPVAKSTLVAPAKPEMGTISQLLEGVDVSAVQNDLPENKNLNLGSNSQPKKDEMMGARKADDSFNF